MKSLMRMFLGIHSGLYRLSGGKLGGTMGRNNVLLLTSTGRKSGKARTVPLGFFERQGGYVIVASNGGAPSQPGWYFNLKNNPHVTIQVFDRVIPVTTEVLSGEERAQAWQQVVATAPPYGDYEKKTTRQIPLIFLHPN